MKKEINFVLIIIGLALLIFLLFGVLGPSPIGYMILFAGSLLLSIGLINLTKFKVWLKFILMVISIIIVLILWFIIGALIHGMGFLF